MCYSVYFSTTSAEDLSNLQSAYFRIHEADQCGDSPALNLLMYDNRWLLEGKYGGCSCHFRHACPSVGIGPVEDWFPEDPEDVESTEHFYDLLVRLASQGHMVDVVSLWADELDDELPVVVVSLSTPRVHFRFLTGVRLALTPAKG